MFKLPQWKEPTVVFPKQSTDSIIGQVQKEYAEKLMLTWEEGAVLLYRGATLIKRVESFHPIAIKDHSSVKPKNSWCWEASLKELTGLSLKNLDSKLPFRKDRGKYYTYFLGVRPTKFLEMYNACMMKAFIPQDLRDEANKYCRGRLGRFHPHDTQIFIKNADHFRQLKKDNMEHMIPLFLQVASRSGKKVSSVSELRKSIGKSNWKTLLKNSPSRNKLIAHNLHNRNHDGWHYSTDFRTILTHLNKLPSGMLPRNVLNDIPEVESVEMFRKMKIVGDREKQRRINQYIRDGKNMTSQLGRKLPKGNSSWNFDQWKDYHEKVTELVTLKKFSKDKFNWVKPYTQEFKSDNYTATLLNNAFEIKMEGEVMKHCVASYSGRSSEGNYIVVSLKDSKGDRYSTLGLTVNSSGVYFNQHYKHCNASVTCDEAKELAKEITKVLNKEWKKVNKVEEKVNEGIPKQGEVSLESCTNLD